MQSLKPRTLIHSLFAAVLCVGAISAPALAQPNQMPMEKAGKAAPSPQKLQAEARSLSKRLGDIERKTIAGDAELQAQQQRFSEHLMAFMQKKGYTPEADRKQLISIRGKLLGGQLKKDERTAQMKQFQTIRARLQKAQTEAMKDKALRQEGQKIRQATMVAMKKHDPQTEALMQRLGKIRQELMSLYQAQVVQRQSHLGK